MNQLRQRQPRLLDPGFLAFLRTKRCCTCGRHPLPANPTGIEAAHIRIGLFAKGMKPHDKHAVPMCGWCHRDGPEAQHKMNETEFWAMWELDPFDIAAKFYAEYGGDGGSPKKRRTIIRPRIPKETRQKIPRRQKPWPKRPFASAMRKS